MSALPRGRLIGWGIALAVLLLFAGANAHLVAVAIASQPACVPHLDHPTGGASAFSAARPSC